ncbi:CBS domain-containing protein [Microvirga massiliensis]|uniref:CBS domain-containing protein n=1 Tax=Microvirga massiliensis TaxID=1033741 RepID=UPI00062BAC90|nr:CBS domain-containing protein [Microvirga massiliensis]
MRAADIMTRDVITLTPDLPVRRAAEILLEHGISAAPVTEAGGRLVGIVSEGDLIRRVEIGTERRRPWFLQMLVSDASKAQNYIKSHAARVADLMTPRVIAATEAMPLTEIADLMERHNVKRIPILRQDTLVGIVSRSDILRAFAGQPKPRDRTATPESVMRNLRAQPFGVPWPIVASVDHGAVRLQGAVRNRFHEETLRVAAEATPGVRSVESRLFTVPSATE